MASSAQDHPCPDRDSATHHSAPSHADQSGDDASGRGAMVALAALVVAAAALFVVRGPARALDNPSDFVLVYGPARAWVLGENPYDQQQVDRVWLEAGGPEQLRPSQGTTAGLLYPPSAVLLFAPLGALRWPAAHYAWVAANIGFVIVILWRLCAIVGFARHQKRTWLLVAGALIFAPLHTAVHHGQTPLYVMALLLLAWPRATQPGGGLALGLSSAIKPQIALPFVALEVVRGRWRSAAIACAIVGVAFAIVVLPLALRGMEWWQPWRQSLAAFASSGAGDPSQLNPTRHQLLNLQYPITALFGNARAGERGALIVCAALAAMFFLPPRLRMSQTSLLLALSMVATLSLMVVYHRFYDGALLLLPMAWALAAIAAGRCVGAGCCVLALLVPFWFNAATVLAWLAQTQRLPASLVESWPWQAIVLPHQSWCLLAMAVCLLVAQRSTPPGARERPWRHASPAARPRPPSGS